MVARYISAYYQWCSYTRAYTGLGPGKLLECPGIFAWYNELTVHVHWHVTVGLWPQLINFPAHKHPPPGKKSCMKPWVQCSSVVFMWDPLCCIIRRKFSEWIFLHWTGTYASTNFLVTSSFAFSNTLVPQWSNVSRHGTSTPPQDAVQCCRLPLTSPVISPLFMMKKWQVRVISFGMCQITVKQLFRCKATAYLLCLLSSSQNVSNGSPTQGLHMCLYTWWLCTLHFTTNWLLVYLVSLPRSLSFSSSRFFSVLNQRNVLRGIDHTFYR